MTKKKKSRKKSFVVFLVSILAIAAIGCFYLIKSGFSNEEKAYIYIDKDDTCDSIRSKIEANAKPEDMKVFDLFAKLLKLDERKRTGKYEITKDLSMLQLIRDIRNHNEVPVKMVVPSAVRTMNDMAGRVAKNLMIDSVAIADYLNDEEKVKNLGYTKETIPALFIPNTYEVYWDMSIDDFFKRLVRENKNFWNESRKAQLAEVSEYAGQKMDEIAVVTLASIVDSETANNGEKPTIAALYLNRLRTGMPLQSDPTVKFALQNFALRRILFEHLKADSPYNTYKNTGLPPGPICVPSIAGIEAVLNHTKNDYIYMCAKEDFSGTHNFSASYAQHLINAAKYSKALNDRNIH